MTRRLNWPLIITTVCDMLMFLGYFGLCFKFMDLGLHNFSYVLSTFYGLLIVCHFHDYFYCLIFPNHIAKEKLNYKYGYNEFSAIFWNAFVLFTPMTLAFCYFGVFNVDFTTWPRTLCQIFFEYWLMFFCKDFISMKILHKWMHKPENFHLHKTHHIYKENILVCNAHSFDWVDLFIENGVGPCFPLLINYFMYGSATCHYFSFLYLAWTDGLVHSLNPLTLCFGNPVLDYFNRINVSHNLHHFLLTS